jgi:acylphosphatase
MQQARAHLLIRGRVQGVFYRAFTRDIASHLGLNGWVRNLDNGSVEALLEGRKEDIEQAITHYHKGPPGARVEDIRVTWEDYKGDLEGFQVRYY